jgi:hypothetical protein
VTQNVVHFHYRDDAQLPPVAHHEVNDLPVEPRAQLPPGKGAQPGHCQLNGIWRTSQKVLAQWMTEPPRDGDAKAAFASFATEHGPESVARFRGGCFYY